MVWSTKHDFVRRDSRQHPSRFTSQNINPNQVTVVYTHVVCDASAKEVSEAIFGTERRKVSPNNLQADPLRFIVPSRSRNLSDASGHVLETAKVLLIAPLHLPIPWHAALKLQSLLEPKLSGSREVFVRQSGIMPEPLCGGGGPAGGQTTIWTKPHVEGGLWGFTVLPLSDQSFHRYGRAEAPKAPELRDLRIQQKLASTAEVPAASRSPRIQQKPHTAASRGSEIISQTLIVLW